MSAVEQLTSLEKVNHTDERIECIIVFLFLFALFIPIIVIPF